MRDDFINATKRTIADRAGHRCSRPDCRAQTSGPQIHESKTLNLGVAAHIAAAAQGGPRYDRTMAANERAAIENAIWLCQNCAKLVDNDPDRFSSDVLHDWKTRAEVLAMSEIGKSDATSFGIPESVADKWVTMAYVEHAGIAQQIKAQGYKICWATADREAELIDLEGWEYVVGAQPDHNSIRYKIQDHPAVGGYLVLLRKR